jgi:hypothetical protein
MSKLSFEIRAIILIVFSIILLGIIFSPKKPNETKQGKAIVEDLEVVADAELDTAFIKRRAVNEILSFLEYQLKTIVDKSIEPTFNAFLEVISIYKKGASLYEENKYFEIDEVKEAVNLLKTELEKSQVNTLPKLREKFVKNISQELVWDRVSARIKGKDVIINAFITSKEEQERLVEKLRISLSMLRFEHLVIENTWTDRSHYYTISKYHDVALYYHD